MEQQMARITFLALRLKIPCFDNLVSQNFLVWLGTFSWTLEQVCDYNLELLVEVKMELLPVSFYKSQEISNSGETCLQKQLISE